MTGNEISDKATMKLLKIYESNRFLNTFRLHLFTYVPR